VGAAKPHPDAGLQPERTSLAWGRTMMTMVVTSLLFLRWMPRYGWFVGTVMGLALLAAFGIYLSQRLRYRRMVRGILDERIHADVVAVFATGTAVAALGLLGVYIVLFLPA